MAIDIRPLRPNEVERIVELAIRAWEPVHASMALALGERLNRRVYPDRAAGQATDMRDACADPDVQVLVAVDDTALLGFVSIVIGPPNGAAEIDMIAVDPAHQRHVSRGS